MTVTLRLMWAEVCARRLSRQGLSIPFRGTSPAAVAAAMCGVQAQIQSAAELSIGLRIADITRTDIQDSLWSHGARRLVKTFGPRGTIHILDARDLPMWTAALSAIPFQDRMPLHSRLTRGQIEDVVRATGAALEDGELTIDELSDAVVAATGPWAGDLVTPAFGGMWPRWRQVLHLAGHRGALCFGPTRGRQVTYASPARWLPGFRPADEEAALAALVRAYLYSYGPASPRHFAQWFGAPQGWATKLFDSLSDNLVEVDVEGSSGWLWTGDSAFPQAGPEGVRLLPYFDAYVIAAQPRSLLFPGRAATRALTPGGQAGNYPVLLVDGTVAGVWHQRRAGRRLEITVEPFVPLSARQRRLLDEQVARIGAFGGGVPRLTIGTVTAGAHA